MEMHDSWLEEVVSNPDGTGFSTFYGSIFRSDGQVFKDAQESGWQKLRFDFEGMRIEGEIGELNTWASGGELWIGGKNDNGIIFLPAEHTGRLCLEMCLAQDYRTLKIHATKIRSTFIGEFEIEAVWDAEGNPKRVDA
ncbi:MAG: hypothetical protein ABR889_10560 [Acidobacteriaceae bacterium]